MRASTKRIYSFLLALLFLIASFFVYAVFLKPEYKKVNMLRGTLQSKKSVLDTQGKIALKVKELLAQYQGVANLQDTISLALPSSEDLSVLYNQLYAISADSNMFLKNIAVSAGALKVSQNAITQGPFKTGTVQVAVSLSGSYEDFRNFLNKIETNIRIMDTYTFSITPALGKSQNQFDFNVVILTYYQTS